jgi:hypothetical protein
VIAVAVASWVIFLSLILGLPLLLKAWQESGNYEEAGCIYGHPDGVGALRRKSW